MAEKIGVYICSGCGIGEALDAEKLVEHVKGTCSDVCSVVKAHPFLCGAEGRALIEEDLKSGAIESVVVGGCSPRLNWDIFDFGDKVIVDRVNLREQCAWSYVQPKAEADGTWPTNSLQLMAQDYLKMGVAKVQNSEVPSPEIPEITKRILVIGGGVTGLNAALNAANAGYEVVLVEKENELGGFARKMYKKYPSKAPFAQAESVGIDELVAQVQSNAKVTIYTGTTVGEIAGAPGMYDLKLNTPGGEEQLKIGSMVLATGWKPYDASKLEHLGYGLSKNVITNVEMEEMAKNGRIVRPSDGKPAKAVAFIQCAGQRDEEHLPYCSAVCCLGSLKQAKYVREFNRDAAAFILYKDMRTPGVYESYYKAAQDDPGVFLTKGDVTGVREEGGDLVVSVKDTLLGESIEIGADLVVLATGMVPTTVEDPILNLAYRQGPGLPDLELFYGFADSNYICFPYESRRTGVYAAGCVHQPMNLASAAEDAAGAALKAIQCLESANRGMAVHPRSGDLTYPKFNFQRCTQCKRCTEECPFGVLNEDEKGTPQPNPTRCRRCGTCMGACPERVISFDNYNVSMIGGMIRKIQVPETLDKGGPRALVLVCENDAYPALDMAAMRGKKWSPFVRFIPVRCLGSVNTIWVADAIGKGVDGVLLLGCKYGDDYQCHFVKGSELCNRRMDNIGETLDRLGVEKQRVAQKQVAIDEYDKIPAMIDDFITMITALGPNPYKGY
jgi:quinone-modifying oxidoreductase, subunit QmoB